MVFLDCNLHRSYHIHNENSADKVWLAGDGCLSGWGADNDGNSAAERNRVLAPVGGSRDRIALVGRFCMAFDVFP